MQTGDTFTFAQGGHLWVVISDPAKHSSSFVIVNLTTNSFRAGNDCVLDIGDHPWITEKSYVSYGDARLVGPDEEAKIARYMVAGTITKNFPMEPLILKDMIECGKKSTALSPLLKKYL
jgi:hypothetical protein